MARRQVWYLQGTARWPTFTAGTTQCPSDSALTVAFSGSTLPGDRRGAALGLTAAALPMPPKQLRFWTNVLMTLGVP